MTDSLHVHRWGQAPAELLCLHGFSLDGRMFAGFAQAFGGGVVAADLPGHGRSAERDTGWAKATAAVAATLEATGARSLLGYSQGGRVALHVALSRPELVERLVLVSSGLGIEDTAARATRVEHDEALARSIESGGVAAFVDAWLQKPLVRPRLDGEAAAVDRALRLEQSAAGLAAALRGLGQGSMPWLGERLSELACPVLWVAGERDARYAKLAKRGAGACLHGSLAILPSGHNAVAEAHAELAEAIRSDWT